MIRQLIAFCMIQLQTNPLRLLENRQDKRTLPL
jgi:hypothetical protein